MGEEFTETMMSISKIVAAGERAEKKTKQLVARMHADALKKETLAQIDKGKAVLSRKQLQNVRADANLQATADNADVEALTEQVAAGQREWQRKFSSGEFAAEANAAKRRLESAAPALLAALKMVQQRWTFDSHQQHTHDWHDWADCNAVIQCAIAKAENQ